MVIVVYNKFVNVSAEQSKKFVQIRLWNDCVNNCSFCSLRNDCRKTSPSSKKTRLKQAAKLIEEIDASQIGLLGGEFFEGQLKGCEDEWLMLLHSMLDSGAHLSITANLIHEQYYLKETIEVLRERLLVCTSYDEVGRFHSKLAVANWFSNIEKLNSESVNLFCTCIPTQDFLTAEYSLPEWLSVNLCDPHLGVDWYINVDKTNYHKHLTEENNLFNLPKRATFIRWMREHLDIARRYVAYDTSHSDTVYDFDENDCLTKLFHERLVSSNCINPHCGHPYFCQCYADSDKCMMCDAQNVINHSL